MIIPPGYALCRLRWRIAGKADEVMSTFGVRLTAGVTNPVTVASDAVQAWIAGWAASTLDNQYNLVGASASIGQDGDPISGDYAFPTGAGTASIATLPVNCALLVRKVTALGGRRNRGRMYVPAGYMGEAAVDELGVIDSATLTAFQTRTTNFLNAITLRPTFDLMVILHETAPATPTAVTDLQVQQVIATQRDRLRK